MYHSHRVEINTGNLSVSSRTLKTGIWIITRHVNTLAAKAFWFLFLINRFYFFRTVLGLEKNSAESTAIHIYLLFTPPSSTIKALHWCSTL